MSTPIPQLDRETRRRLAIIRHVEAATGNVALTCRYYGISRQAYYIWYRRYLAEGVNGLRSRRRATPPGSAGPRRWDCASRRRRAPHAL